MELIPIYDKVVISPIEVQEVTRGGIVLPDFVADRASDAVQRGIVVSVGDGRVLSDGSLLPSKIQPGDHVLFAKFGGTHLDLPNGEKVIVMNEHSVHCIIRGDPNEPLEITGGSE